jgi:hypothetical protein
VITNVHHSKRPALTGVNSPWVRSRLMGPLASLGSLVTIKHLLLVAVVRYVYNTFDSKKVIEDLS